MFNTIIIDTISLRYILAQHSLLACPITPPTRGFVLYHGIPLPASMISSICACCTAGDRVAYYKTNACGYFFSNSEAFSPIATNKFQLFRGGRLNATAILYKLYSRSPFPPPSNFSFALLPRASHCPSSSASIFRVCYLGDTIDT